VLLLHRKEGMTPRHGVLRAAAARTESRHLWFAAAATIVVGLALWIGVAVFRDDSSYTTAVGEQRSITLADGSVIFLNTSSAVRVRYGQSARDIELIRGEARFQVAKCPLRPFTVATSVASVRALGTRKGIEPDVGPSIESVNAWTQRRLVFRDMTLLEVINQFNRYRRQPLVIDDPTLGQMRVSGTFDPGDLDSLVGYLASVGSVQVHTPADGSVHLSHIQP
jgi:transmembrane sensor